jgi:hypothetical protein
MTSSSEFSSDSTVEMSLKGPGWGSLLSTASSQDMGQSVGGRRSWQRSNLLFHGRAGAKGYLLKESAGRDVVKAVEAYRHQREKAGMKSLLERLCSREREILQLVGEGKTSAEIAETL